MSKLGHSLDKIVDSAINLKQVRKAGLRFQANIIVGYPGEKEDDFSKTVDFIKRIRPNNIGFNIFMPLPGTHIYNRLKEAGRSIPPWEEIGDPEGSGVCYADMPRERFDELYLRTRLKVILPINLHYFIKDNLSHPLRLIRISLFQFKGVIVKTIRSFARLAKIKKTNKVLYVSYNAASEPLFQSQGIAYLQGLSKKGADILLLTFEKDKNKSGIIEKSLRESNIAWRRLKYHKRPRLLATIWDVLSGNVYITGLLAEYNIKALHARGVIAAAMSFIPSKIFRLKFIFDIRSSLAEAYASAGYWRRKGIGYKVVKFLERFCILHADLVVVETSVHAHMLQGLCANGKLPPIEIIPCCVDLNRFRRDLIESQRQHKHSDTDSFRLSYIGSLSGWYMLDEMFGFFAVLKRIVQNAEFIFFTDDADKQILSRISKIKN